MFSTNSVTDEKEEIFSEGFYQKGNYDHRCPQIIGVTRQGFEEEVRRAKNESANIPNTGVGAAREAQANAREAGVADGAAVLRHSDPYCYCCCLHVRRGEQCAPSLRAVIFGIEL